MAGNETSAMLGQKKPVLEWTGLLHELAYVVLSAAVRPHPTQVSIIQERHEQVHCTELREESWN